jgi:hypothetical protein
MTENAPKNQSKNENQESTLQTKSNIDILQSIIVSELLSTVGTNKCVRLARAVLLCRW